MPDLDVTLQDYVRSSYPVIVVETFDQSYTEERMQILVQKLHERGVSATLDVVDLRSLKGKVAAYVDDLSKKPAWTIAVLRNMHFFLKDNSFLQAVQNFVASVQKGDGPRILVGTCPSIDELPQEIARETVVVRDPLPTERELLSYTGDLVATYSRKGVSVDSELAQKVARIGRGMTRSEFRRAFRLSLVKTETVDPQLFVEVKKQILKESSALELYQPQEGDMTMDDLAGMDRLKFFVRRTRGRGRGILCMGPAGTGKTAFAQSMASEFKIPLIVLDVGSLFHGIVGSSEARMRRMLATVEAFGESILLADEMEKAFSGAGNTGSSTDGGTTQRTLSRFLTWLSDRRRLDTFVVATCNSLSLPPEYIRAGRFSGVFYLTLPSAAARKEIWKVHMKRAHIEEQYLPDDVGWSGAEIAQCCETASLMGVSLKQAAGYVTKVSQVAKDKLEELDRFAKEAGLIPADDPEEDEDVEDIV